MSVSVRAVGGLLPIWEEIFNRDSKWLQEMEELRSIKPTVLPTLVGCDLRKIFRPGTPVYLVLLVHDWSGELQYSEGSLFESLKSFKSITKDELQILGTKITINIAECLGTCSRTGDIVVKDPRRLLGEKDGQPYTSILYYGNQTIYDVPSGHIGGIIDRSFQGRKQTRYICSIRMQSGDQRPVYRVFVREKMAKRLQDVVTRDEYGRHWVTHWKELRSGWLE